MIAAVASATKSVALTRADLKVIAPRGHEIAGGGIAWAGVLLVQNLPLARFSNDGEGGCVKYDVRPTPEGRALFADVEALAKQLFPEIKFEQTDHLIGQLWDEAVMAGN